MMAVPAAGGPAAQTLAATGCQFTDNLVQNCGFESSLDHWTASEPANAATTGDVPDSWGSPVGPDEGTAAFAGSTDPSSTTDVATLTQTFAPADGVAYRASFMYMGGDAAFAGSWLEASITYGTRTVVSRLQPRLRLHQRVERGVEHVPRDRRGGHPDHPIPQPDRSLVHRRRRGHSVRGDRPGRPDDEFRAGAGRRHHRHGLARARQRRRPSDHRLQRLRGPRQRRGGLRGAAERRDACHRQCLHGHGPDGRADVLLHRQGRQRPGRERAVR